ncbi:MAG: N-acetyltransferase family protein [Candidatus Dormibacteria bacterium]
MQPPVTIRRIAPSDAELLRKVRVRAITDSPSAFGSTLAETEARTFSWWQARALQTSTGHDDAIFFAEADGAVVGIAGGYIDWKEQSAPQLISMWVDPARRQEGIGRRLVERVAAWAAAGGHSRLQLWVTETNTVAISLYERLGFMHLPDRQPLPSAPTLMELKMERFLSG